MESLQRPVAAMPGELAGASVLVIGAGGFIGGRLTERLVVECGARVRALVRAPMSAASVARFPVDIRIGDIANPPAVMAAARGCSHIFNCAKGTGPNAAKRRTVDVDAVRSVIEAARRASAMVVHVSTMAVYDRPFDGDFDETTRPAPRGDPYTDGKLDGERLAVELGARWAVPVVVVQPGVVYGPGAGVYGVDIIEELTNGGVVLVDGGRGICNAVYIDDLVSGLLLAAQRRDVAGERFLLSGPEYPTWRDFFESFERLLGTCRTVSLSRAEAHALWRRSRRRAWLAPVLWQALREDRALRRQLLATREGRLLRRLARWTLPKSLQLRLRQDRDLEVSHGRESPPVPLRPWVIDYVARRARARTDKARTLLGYAPAFTLEHGMQVTGQWARWVGLIPEPE
ncbi:MAG: hypothetical protein A3F70_12610 [Acidobacteria bacterium RIFCSPLOWO2_12_FULL_67_14]|nr:MAG: hypothetical protein A3H29_00710 [Acidobacteria bacterium RIFCSPLOWO2_02_FULL_67_21]OFW37214.1 MAG: hypothetical protein A3F70_12610 [Acidobacteria bacterium RIFCSPLOWO2_12_FULL_67_14]